MGKDLSSQSDNSKTAYLTVKAQLNLLIYSEWVKMKESHGVKHTQKYYSGLKKTYNSFLSKSFHFMIMEVVKSSETKSYSDSYK